MRLRGVLCVLMSHRWQPLMRSSAYGWSTVLRCQRCGHERVAGQ